MADAAENLARAERAMEFGITNDAIAYALMSLAASMLSEEEQAALPDEREHLRQRSRYGPGFANEEPTLPAE